MMVFMEPMPVTTALPPPLLLSAYAQGIFPMARNRHSREVYWFSPDPRAVMPLHDVHISRSLRRTLRQRRFDIRLDTAFEQVMQGCAAPREDETDTWINDTIIEAFTDLHRLGMAHSIETWRDGQLMGGLYGLAIGGAFFGESMYRDTTTDRSTDASKVALIATVRHLRHRGYTLFDVQYANPHIEQFGIIEIPRDQYLAQLQPVISQPITWQDAD